MKNIFKTTTAAAALLLTLGMGAAMAQTAIDQTPTNSGDVNTRDPGGGAATLTGVGSLGDGASVSVGASGASAVSSLSGIQADFAAPTGGYGTVDQTSSNTGDITTDGSITFDAGATAAGAGASAAVSASGAGASFVITGNNTTEALAVPDVGNVTQSATNGVTAEVDGAILNTGTITGSALVLSGDGASVSVSASGASTVVATTGIDAAVFGGSTIGTVGQTATNYGGVTNDGTVTVTDVSGDAASVGVSARGSSASINATTIASTAPEGNTYGAVTQDSTNEGTIGNTGDITAGALSGVGSSVSIGASGATASFSVASINDTAGVTSTTVPSITQTVDNIGAVSNNGSIALTGALATGASASISSTGAGSYASFSTVAMAP